MLLSILFCEKKNGGVIQLWNFVFLLIRHKGDNAGIFVSVPFQKLISAESTLMQISIFITYWI